MKKLNCILLSMILLLSSTITTQATSYTHSLASTSSNTYTEDLGNGYYGITTIEYSNTSACAIGQKTGSVTCNSATYSTSILKSGWSFSSASASKSGGTAYGSFTAICKTNGITTNTISKNVTLNCDKSGNLY